MISKKGHLITALIITASLCAPLKLSAQNAEDKVFVDPNMGAKQYRKTQIIDANRVETIFGNWGMFGKRDDKKSGVWPKGTGHGHIHEMTLLVGADVVGKNGKEYTIISESYSEGSDESGGKQYWWNPLPGYASETKRPADSLEVAISSEPDTWPDFWPDKMSDQSDPGWVGKWNGYFGKNQMNADQEAFYIIDDFQNSEYQYYPFGDNVTDKRGLGLQVQTRLFEWQHSLAQDQVFILFNVSNASPTTYNQNILMGAFADTHPAGLGSASDQNGYSKENNMVYAWAYQNKGVWETYTNILPGYMAWKYLESPGIGNDGIDNDNDGLVDERRDNEVGPNDEKFRTICGIYNDGQYVLHYLADEDGDWDPEVDDIGRDGIASTDLNYVGPDADGSEGDGRPQQGEPNFGYLDNDESDQLGLTSFYAPEYNTSLHIANDEEVWDFIQPGYFETFGATNANYLWLFASGPFYLASYNNANNESYTERFSTCFIFGEDQNAIFRSAATSQRIYDNDYTFSKPPEQPTVSAVAGDKKITLYWDNFAEKSYDPIYGKDFEGYRIYRGTDAQLSEAQKITDATGKVVYMKPTAQFDLIDNLKGAFPIALGAEEDPSNSYGIHYYMGDDTGIQYYYEDTDLINGMVYYYVVVAYDKGYYTGMDDRNLEQMTPSESSWYITYDGGKVTGKSKNAVVISPNSLATNYVPGYVTNVDSSGVIIKDPEDHAAGDVAVSILDPDKIPENTTYEVTFYDTLNTIYETNTVLYNIKNLNTGEYLYQDAIVPFVPLDTTGAYDLQWISAPFDGMYLNFNNMKPTITKTIALSAWNDEYYTRDTVNRPLKTSITQLGLAAPTINATIEVTSDPGDIPFTKSTPVYFKVYDTYTKEPILFTFVDVNKDSKLGTNDNVEFLLVSGTKKIPAYAVAFTKPGGVASPRAPEAGDKFSFYTDRPFTKEDTLHFSTEASFIKEIGGESLNAVKVVPNPYVVAAPWERSTTLNGRGERRIDFTHLPNKCTIRIFTQNGVLLKTIEHNESLSDGTASWDLTTRDGLEVAFGVYVFHIDAEGIGERIGTFAIIN